MKTFLSGAIALAAAAPASHAVALSTSDWLGLDEELNSLASTVNLQGDGIDVGALLRSNLLLTSDFDGGTGEDTLGLVIDDARLWANGALGDFDWRVSFDFSENSVDVSGMDVHQTFFGSLFGGGPDPNYEANLQDAYAVWKFDEAIALTWGRFRAPSSISSTTHQDSLLFTQRTNLGDFAYQFDEGVMLSGNYGGNFNWHVAAQNGVDGTDDDIRFLARAEIGLGEGARPVEGAYGSSDQFSGKFGVSYIDEGSFSDGEILVFDIAGSVGATGFAAEMFQFEDGWGTTDVLDTEFGLAYASDASPWSVSLSQMLSPETWELAGRYETFDDDADTSYWSVGLNYYLAGHNAKWQLSYTDVSSDVDANEGNFISLGLTVGFEGYGQDA